MLQVDDIVSIPSGGVAVAALAAAAPASAPPPLPGRPRSQRDRTAPGASGDSR